MDDAAGGTETILAALDAAGLHLSRFEDGPYRDDVCCRPGRDVHRSRLTLLLGLELEPEPEPEDPDRSEADTRAESLLESLLDETQLASYRSSGTFWVDTPRGQVRLGRHYDLQHISVHGVKRSLCVVPDTVESLPDADVWATLLLWLTEDPDRFFRVALPGPDAFRHPPQPEDGLAGLLSIELDRFQAVVLDADPQKSVFGTGIPRVDRALAGIGAGHVVLVIGRPGSGKTALALNMAMHTATHLGTGGDPRDPLREMVCLCAPRESTEETMRSLLAHDALVRREDLTVVELYDFEWNRLSQVFRVIADLPIAIHAKDSVTETPLWPPAIADHPTPLVVLDDATTVGGDLAHTLADAHELACKQAATVVVTASTAQATLESLPAPVADLADAVIAIDRPRPRRAPPTRRHRGDVVVTTVSVLKNRLGPVTTSRAVRVDGWRRFLPVEPG